MTEGGYVGLLPKRFDPLSYEGEILSWWWSEVYPKIKEARKDGPRFYFLDGPPYVTNPIHVGTAWNKILKDSILRHMRMKGYLVRDQPGYDMHGLPIEVMVERRLGLSSKREIEEKLGIAHFVEECRSYALKNLGVLTEQFKNLGVWMDWDKPYRTIDNDYIEAIWLVVRRAFERGLLERGVKVVHWCPRCGTVLAGYEVTEEYRDVESPSIYVKFPLEGKDREYILIWTTTPWTLPANVAIMVNPDYNYVKVRANDEFYILAEGRCEQVFKEVGLKYEVVENFSGHELEGLSYIPPLADEVPKQRELKEKHKAHLVVLSREYVTLTEGTGCVHVAPGHGEEDFEVGVANALPVLSPVDDRGVFTEEAGKYAGKGVFEANEEIVADLKSKGLLLHRGVLVHRYPHCWRCKSPLILRASLQWFIKVTAIKDTLLKENDKVKWIPGWAGMTRFKGWLEKARDWVISRQRYWGAPLPIWICEKCARFTVVSSVRELSKLAVSPIPDRLDLHRPWIDDIKLRCECGGTMKRVPDVLDVWVDSGVASWACLGYPNTDRELSEWWPADLVLEGHDQTRGWFYTLLVTSVVVFNRAPYRSVLVHGFSLDEQGRAMHKSLGNIIYPEEVIEKYGRDALRWYELGCTTWEDLHFSLRGVEESFRELNIIWNAFYFASLYMSLDNFNPLRVDVKDFLTIEDRWLLSKTQRVIEQVTSAMENLAIHEAVRTAARFILDDVSRWYIRLIRRRTWIDRADPAKLAAYYALYQALYAFVRLVAPFIPFLAEKVYQHVFRPVSSSMPVSVHLCKWPEPDPSLIDERLERLMNYAKSLSDASNSLRQAAKIKLRRPLRRAIVVYRETELRDCVKELKHILLDLMNVKEIELMVEELRPAEGLVRAEVSGGVLLLDLGVTEELLDEGLAREIVRRLQEMRKELDLSVDAYVDAYVATSNLASLERIKRKEDYLKSEVRVHSLELLTAPTSKEGFYVKEWEIDGVNYKLGIKLASLS
ncbi:MAG: isoleucine--tRNA ligase [Candidatus Nezhaarchaeota archaeon]|nr:isoleucine--tRNA ligase [Candidatus Nezhaarchaeota archaeon]